MTLHLRPVHFVDTPIGLPDGYAARLAGGMQWFAAYEVIAPEGRRIVPVADIASLGPRAAALHLRITAPRAPLVLGARTLRLDQPLVAGILNVTPDSFSDGGRHADSDASKFGLDCVLMQHGKVIVYASR